MKSVRINPLVALIAGLALLSAGPACAGGSDPPPTATSQPNAATSTPAQAATATPTPAPPTATPTPFSGKISRFTYTRFGIDAPIEELSVNADNEMESPVAENVSVGWYNSELKPGSAFLGTRPGWEGNAVFSAHVYYINRSLCPDRPLACPAPFQKLAQATTGDEVVITMENGQEYRYRVISKAEYPVETIDMGRIIAAPDRPAGKQWITMITCGGAFDASGLNYLSRDVVIAERIS